MNAPLILDLLGVFFFAVSGSLLAARKGFDLVGSLLLASLAALGGGVARDVVIGVVPVAFSNPVYLAPPLLATLLVYFLYSRLERVSKLLMLFDAGGLALFCIVGTLKAVNAGFHPVAAVLLGVTTAVGGGLLRDVVANEVPQLFNPGDIYALPAFLGAALTVVLAKLDWFNALTGVAVAVLVFLLRVFAWRAGWQAPLATRMRNPRPPAAG